MKRNAFRLIIFLASLVVWGACSNAPTPNAEIHSFDDFLWKSYVPDTIKTVINTDFSECEHLSKPLVLQLCDETGRKIGCDEVRLFVNGALSEDNTITIPLSQKSTELGIVLQKKSTRESRTFNWYLSIVDNPGLVKINENTLASELPVGGTDYNVKVLHGANTLRVTTDVVLCVLLILFIVVTIIIRLNHPAFKVTKLYISNDDGQRTVRLNGVGKVIFTAKRQKQPALQVLFFRKVVYFTDEFFTLGDLVIEPKFGIRTDSGRRNGVRLASSQYDVAENTLAKDEETVIVNSETNQKIIIKVQ